MSVALNIYEAGTEAEAGPPLLSVEPPRATDCLQRGLFDLYGGLFLQY